MLAVAEQRDAVIAVAQVCPPLSTNLEHRARLRRVHMRRPPDVSELTFIRGLARAHGHRKCDLEHLVPLVPVGCGLETQHARARLERDALFEDRVAEPAAESDRDEGVAMLDVEIPGIPPARIFSVGLENASWPAQH